MSVAEKISKLQDMPTAELAAEYERLHGRAPRYRSRPWMRKRIAFKLQENAYGGLSAPARAELERLVADLRLPEAAPQRPTGDARTPKGQPKPGTLLQRDWRGQQIRVEITPDGVLYGGELFGSLSAVAKRVTGQHWSGPRFFNLTTRSK